MVGEELLKRRLIPAVGCLDAWFLFALGSNTESVHCEAIAADASRNVGGLSLLGHVERRLSSDPR
jgi:hypothetical protein